MAVAHSSVVSAFSMLSRHEPSMSEEPPPLTNVAGNISSTGSRNGLSSWGIM